MHEKIQQSLQLINHHICENIALNRIAAGVFLSPRHFHRLFKKYTGKSPAKYVEQKKMENALRLLQKPNMFITDVAYALGYRNYETFSGRFKQHFNISPGDLKNILETIRIHMNETGNSLNFQIISSSYKNIPQKLKRVKETLTRGQERIESFIAVKRKTKISPGTKAKYQVSKYNDDN